MSVSQRQEQILSLEEVVSRGREKADNQQNKYAEQKTKSSHFDPESVSVYVCVNVNE